VSAAGPEAPSGLVVVDKPGGITSHDVVARARRALGTRKVGHAGTLDPMATGVLVLGVGRATRLLGHLTLTEKAYDATIRLGVATSTDDAEGEVVSTAAVDDLSAHSVRDALGTFVGEIDQAPSSVSAIKVDGKRAHQRVREGERVELPTRRVTVHTLDLHRLDGADLDISVRCSSGTYIRAIARDLGRALGVGGHLTALRRTAVGPFGLAGACSLDDLAARGRAALLPMAAAARDTFSSIDLTDEQAAGVRVGRALDLDLGASGPVALFAPDGAFLALYESRGNRAVATAVFV
jgi:tRNA pseudouridine55 synthase